ncbi:hypothetical protein ABIE69_002126 [Rhodobacteraceae bacterium MBR-64]|jgi:hypothetical protein
MTPVFNRIRRAVPMTVFAVTYLSLIAIVILT